MKSTVKRYTTKSNFPNDTYNAFCTWSYIYFCPTKWSCSLKINTQILKFFDSFFYLLQKIECMFLLVHWKNENYFFVTLTWSFHVSQCTEKTFRTRFRLLGTCIILQYGLLRKIWLDALKKLHKQLISFLIRNVSDR